MSKPHRILFTQVPLAQLAAAFASGIVVAEYWQPRLSLALLQCALLSLVGVLTVVAGRHRVSGFILMLAMSSAGASLHTLTKYRDNPNTLKHILDAENLGEREAVELTGTLDGPPEFARDRLYLTVRIDEIKLDQEWRATKGEVSVLAVFHSREEEQHYRNLDLRYNERVQVRVTLRRNDQFRNPGVSSLTEFLDLKGWDAVALLKSAGAITRLEQNHKFSLVGILSAWRLSLQTRIDALFDADTAGVLDASLLGNRYNLSSEVIERFRAGGTFHVLVISGFHISFLGGLVYWFARRLTRSRILQFLFSASVVWCYSFAVGGDASVVRAALMFTFVAFASVLFRPSFSLNAVGASALVILLWRPRELFDPSFQLTFLSVVAIVALALPVLQKVIAIGRWYPTRSTPYPPTCSRLLKSIAELLFWSERAWQDELKRSTHTYRLLKSPVAVWLDRHHLQLPVRYTFSAVVVSVSVQLMLLPLMVVYFHRLSLASIVLNIGVSALLGLLSVLAVFGLVLQGPFITAANAVNSLMVRSVEPFTRVGLDSIRVPEYTGPLRTTYFLYYVPMLLLLVGVHRWQPLNRARTNSVTKRTLAIGATLLVMLVVLVVLHPWSAPRGDGRLHVHFLDVGQGDSALVVMPDGMTMLVDGGGRPNFVQLSGGKTGTREQRSIGETVVSEYLWWRGLDRVDYVLATHADADHIDGLNDVVRNFSVRSAIVARTPTNDAEFARFTETLKVTNTPLTTVGVGDVLSCGPVSVEVLAPVTDGDSSGNDDSLVLRLKFGERAILLTGDVEKRGEAALLNSHRQLNADVVKVAHHGSRTSSTGSFVSATHPSIAIISVGLTSMFGHPHKEVIDRWREAGAEVLTTGKCGTITVTTDGKDLILTSYVAC